MAAIHIAGIAVDVAIGTAAAAVAPVVVTGAVVGAIGYLVVSYIFFEATLKPSYRVQTKAYRPQVQQKDQERQKVI